MSSSQGDFKHFVTFIHLKIYCSKCEQHLNIPISEDKVDSGLSGRGAKCSVKARWESKTGCCYLTFPSCNATLMRQFNSLRGHFVLHRLNSVLVQVIVRKEETDLWFSVCPAGQRRRT